jgi:lipopolysaccharide transport protein LptA
MRYSGANRRFLFTGGIKVWQGKEMLLTKEMAIVRDSGRLTCREGVRTYITVQPEADKEERRLDIKSESLEFKPEERRLNYSGDAALKVEDVQIKADDVFIYLSEEEKKIEVLMARGQVSIKQGSYEARGQEAVINLEKETIELMGQPVLIDKQKGKVQGDKLTFYMADDKIVVENEGRERSETVIKS